MAVALSRLAHWVLAGIQPGLPARPGRGARRRILVFLPACALMLAGLLWPLPTAGSPLPYPPSQSLPGAGRLYSETGFRLGAPGDPFADYFAARGGLATFGYPTSRPFTLLGTRVQFFQRHVMQQLPTGVGLLNILDEDFMPYSDFGTVVVPAVASSFTELAPAPGAPDYGSLIAIAVAEVVPNTWLEQPVGFLDAFLQPGVAGGETDPIRQSLVGLEIFGFPISPAAPDSRNAGFVLQRFQRAVLQHESATGLTRPLLTADFLKAIMTGAELPQELATQAQGGRFFLQYRPGSSGWIARPAELPDTDLTLAFEREDGGATGWPLAPTPLAMTPPSSGPLPPVRPSPPAFQPPMPGFLTPTAAFPPLSTSVSLQPTPSLTPTPIPERPFVQGTEPGGAAAGQDIVIRGRYFGDQPGQVLFTGKLATPQVWSDSNIVVTVPEGAVDGTVRVRRPDGTISNAVGFNPYTTPTATATQTTATPTLSPTPSPTITPSPTSARPTVVPGGALDPFYGPRDSNVLIRGSGFGSSTGNVLFGNYTAPIQLWSDTSILVSVPSQLDTPRTVRVSIVRADGAVSEPPGPLCFIVSPAPGTPSPIAATATLTPNPPAGC